MLVTKLDNEGDINKLTKKESLILKKKKASVNQIKLMY